MSSDCLVLDLDSIIKECCLRDHEPQEQIKALGRCWDFCGAGECGPLDTWSRDLDSGHAGLADVLQLYWVLDLVTREFELVVYIDLV